LKKIAIIGAGPAGLTAAYLISKKNIQVDLYEASDSVGGMAKSINLWGQTVDLGPHRFFSSDPRVNKLWLEILKKDYDMVNRLTRIYYKQTFFDYPLKPLNALFGLGIIESVRCIFSFFFAKLYFFLDKSTFEGWVKSKFGTRLFEIFFRSYSEKLWGISCKKLDSDFAAQRIKKLSLFEAVKSAFLNSKKNKHKTLVDEFAYPLKGSGSFYQILMEEFIKYGGNLFLKTPVISAYPHNQNANKFIIETKDLKQSYDHVVSTMPLTILVNKINAPKEITSLASKLKFRNTILVYLLLDCESPFPDQWIYVHSSNLKTGRITNFSNWVPSIKNNQKETIVCLEYWCNEDDLEWKETDENLIALAKNEIHQSTLVDKKNIIKGSIYRVPRCYPVYSVGYKKNLIPIEKYLSTFKNLSVIGRYGSFKYNNQDHSILMGILAADNIINNSNNNLWELNTDYEYQESNKITKTGLISN